MYKCESCRYKIEKIRNVVYTQCPYCGKKDGLKEVAEAKDLLDEDG